MTVSRWRGVILTARRAQFIFGETEAMVPLTMVPFFISIVTVSFWHFIKKLAGRSEAVRGAGRMQTRLPDELHGGSFLWV